MVFTNQDCGRNSTGVSPRREKAGEERDKDIVSKGQLSKFKYCGGVCSSNYFLPTAFIDTLTILTKHVFNLLQCYPRNRIG